MVPLSGALSPDPSPLACKRANVCYANASANAIAIASIEYS